jgi:hypothetical protein
METMVTRPGQATERGRRRSHFLVTIVAMFLVIEMAIRQSLKSDAGFAL